MSLKDRFILFVELQRAANAAKDANGPMHPSTIVAYGKANAVKRELVDKLDQVDPTL